LAPEQGPYARSPDHPLIAGRDEAALAREVVERLLQGVGLRAGVRANREAAGLFIDIHLPVRGTPGRPRVRGLPAGRQAMFVGAAQHLAHLIVQRKFPGAPPVYLALAGQREQRSNQLQGKTVAVARLVLESGREMALDMVYEYEMKIVRDALRQFPSLFARAVDVGDELRRNVVIAPVRR